MRTSGWKRWLPLLLAGMLLLGALSGCSLSENGGLDYSKPSGYAQQVLELVNEERAKVGASPLTLDSRLCAAADERAEEITVLFEHTRPDGSSCFTILREYGVSYYTAGENISAGRATAAAVVEGWMNSPGHRANILNSEFKYLGVGRATAYDVYGTYWVQLFTG